MKRVLFIVVLALITVVSSANELSKLVGTWKYKAEHAPYGYDQGELIFTQKEGKVLGEVKIQGYTMKLENLKVAEGVYHFGVTIDYTYVAISGKLESDKFSGVAKSPEGDLPITATRVKPEN